MPSLVWLAGKSYVKINLCSRVISPYIISRTEFSGPTVQAYRLLWDNSVRNGHERRPQKWQPWDRRFGSSSYWFDSTASSILATLCCCDRAGHAPVPVLVASRIIHPISAIIQSYQRHVLSMNGVNALPAITGAVDDARASIPK